MLHVFWIFFPLLPGYALQRRGRDLQGTLTPSFARIVWNLRPGYQQQQQQVPFDRFNMERLDFSFLPFFIDECVVVLTRLGSELHRDTCILTSKKISIFLIGNFQQSVLKKETRKDWIKREKRRNSFILLPC